MSASPGATGSHLAAIDVGTNSFHLVVVRLTANGYAVVERRVETIRLGHGLVDTGMLAPEAIERGVAALVRMKRIADVHAAPVRAVATSAVRTARNAGTFLERARHEAGVDIEVVSGLDEARLIHLGVLQAIPVHDRRLLLVDVGGGSTELLIGRAGDTLAATSLELGAVRLTDRFFPEGHVDPDAVAECRAAIESAIEPFAVRAAEVGFDLTIASSGTALSLVSMASARAGASGGGTARSGDHVTIDEIDAIADALVGHRSTAERRSVPGLDPRRADIIVAGVLILQSVAHALGVATIVYSASALREGIVVDTLARIGMGAVDGLSR